MYQRYYNFQLRNQITFLQHELKTKNTIIKMLIKERNNDHDSSHKTNSHTLNDLNFNSSGTFVNTRSGNNILNVNSTGKIGDENINVNINQKS